MPDCSNSESIHSRAVNPFQLGMTGRLHHLDQDAQPGLSGPVWTYVTASRMQVPGALQR